MLVQNINITMITIMAYWTVILDDLEWPSRITSASEILEKSIPGGFAIGVRVALLWQHYGNAWQSPAVGQPHAARMAHTHTTHAGELDSPRRRMA